MREVDDGGILSVYMMEPLTLVIWDDKLINGVNISRGRKVKCIFYMDDVNVTVQDSISI